MSDENTFSVDPPTWERPDSQDEKLLPDPVLGQWEAAANDHKEGRIDWMELTQAGDALAEAYRAEKDENERLVQSNRDDQISFLRGQLREAKAENERLTVTDTTPPEYW